MRHPWKVSCLLSVVLLAGGAALPVCGATSDGLLAEVPEDKVIEKEPDANPIDGQYIVVLADGVHPDSVSRGIDGEVLHVYRSALNGFAARLSATDVETLRLRDDVLFLEQDHEVTTQEVLQASPPSWGLDRVDQRFLDLDDEYWYYTDAGNVHAYVLDTGIYAAHLDFEGRVDTSPGGGFTSINDGNGTHDCHGHGTHVAGTLGGETYGIAKEVVLHPVRVLNCFGSGTFAGVVAGVDWVTANHVKPAVANMSLGGASNLSLDLAVGNSVAAGVFYAVAAGNSNLDACLFSPAGAPSAYTVAATDANDQRAWFSNFGTCVEVFAPGVAITSAWNTSTTATHTISGTSMASPHVAGAAALYLSEYPLARPAEVGEALSATATPGLVGNPGVGSPNLLLDTRLGSRLWSEKGALTAVGQQAVHPLGTFFFARVDGPHEARLSGPAGADFDLALFKFDPALLTFFQVASSSGPGAAEHVIHHDTEGLYFWSVTSASGTGTYKITFSQP